jgi:hypothetical protein
MGLLRVLDGDREEVQSWHTEDEEELDSARSRFEELRAQGFLACRIPEGSKEGGPLLRFDPQAEEILLIRFVDGG